MRVERHVLIIVQNFPLPFDRRVWPECHARVDQELVWCHQEQAYLDGSQRPIAGARVLQRTGS